MKRAIAAVLFLAAACASPEFERHDDPGSRTSRMAPGDAYADTRGMRAALDARGLALDSLLSRSGAHVAVAARGRDGRVHVAVLRRGPGGYALLGSELQLENVPPQRVSWPQLGEHQAVSYTHDIPVEGLVGTVVRIFEGDSLRLAYADPGRVCRPAELRDLDGDGILELISFPEEAFGGDCSSECHTALRSRFDDGAHWTSVHRWTAGEWVSAEAAFPAFYAEVADQYRRMDAWTSGDESTCMFRAMNSDVFARWAERAERLALAP